MVSSPKPAPGRARAGGGCRRASTSATPTTTSSSSPCTTAARRSVALRQAQHVLGEVVEDHLLGDGRDLVEPDLAPEALDVELLGVAVAAVRLQRHVTRLEAGFGAEQLGDVGLRATRLAVVEEPRGLQAHR